MVLAGEGPGSRGLKDVLVQLADTCGNINNLPLQPQLTCLRVATLNKRLSHHEDWVFDQLVSFSPALLVYVIELKN